MKNKGVFLFLLLCLLLAACGKPVGEPEESQGSLAVSSPNPLPEPTETPLLAFPDGSLHDPGETELDLSWLRHEDAAAAGELLAGMPQLQRVELGADNALTAEDVGPGALSEQDAPAERLSWEDIRLLEEAAPQVEFCYRFRFYGKDFSLLDKTMDLNHIPMDDEGAAVREVLSCMNNCTYLDMDFCGVSNEAMAAIREDFPQVEVVWRIWFGRNNCCSVRTDTERIMASKLEFQLEAENTQALKYCTKVKYLDLGHMPNLTDWSFLGYMPELEVVVVSLGGWTDLSGLANCPHLEYLEMCSRANRDAELDLSFLANLKELKHLNIACLFDGVVGYEALETLPQLERLYIGHYTYIPEDYLEHLREALPDTEINTTQLSGCDGTWRYSDGYTVRNARYALLCQQFDYAHYDRVCSLYYNDPLYYPHD